MASDEAIRAFVEPLLLPVEMRVAQVVSVRGVKGVNYIVASNGTIVSMGLPEVWAKHIVRKLNEDVESKHKQDERLLFSMVITDCDLVEEWQGQVFEISKEDGLPYRKANFRFNRLITKVKTNMAQFRRYKRKKVPFPLKQPLHIIATIYMSDKNEGTLPEFLAVIHRLMQQVGIVGWKQKNSWVKSYDGSRVIVVPKEQARVEIVIKEYKG